MGQAPCNIKLLGKNTMNIAQNCYELLGHVFGVGRSFRRLQKEATMRWAGGNKGACKIKRGDGAANTHVGVLDLRR